MLLGVEGASVDFGAISPANVIIEDTQMYLKQNKTAERGSEEPLFSWRD